MLMVSHMAGEGILQVDFPATKQASSCHMQCAQANCMHKSFVACKTLKGLIIVCRVFFPTILFIFFSFSPSLTSFANVQVL